MKSKKDIQEVIDYLCIMKEDMRLIKQRLLSIETWLAALSKQKDLGYSSTHYKNLHDLDERMHPTIYKDAHGEIKGVITSVKDDEGNAIIFTVK